MCFFEKDRKTMENGWFKLMAVPQTIVWLRVGSTEWPLNDNRRCCPDRLHFFLCCLNRTAGKEQGQGQGEDRKVQSQQAGPRTSDVWRSSDFWREKNRVWTEEVLGKTRNLPNLVRKIITLPGPQEGRIWIVFWKGSAPWPSEIPCATTNEGSLRCFQGPLRKAFSHQN